ncbi:ATP-binding cassette domain-containing protein [Thermanaerothrix sp. 4228-RoL]|jgi:ABC-2 type transport system ATP-binding protein|uniref:ATP-binding cassette domain-containing protein n=1 Tax=Thermanaerothrix solaris TaxID=3058434 RepID=A0ABU3NLM2_9CHLR|nr:ATP-binding cassette domain-containing protein [Thermanaerothrix sp. 4228-RoL]MDT8897739.1 ATP-binding cassette domain-containing protein [Thermanaerothrix sp. 4228-RoL]
MSHAVVVNDVYKQFGKNEGPFWKALFPPRSSNGNGNGKHGASTPHSPFQIIVAVDHVSFTVEEGEIFGILGPNGGGKSTLIRLIATLLLPDKGKISVFGYDVVRQPLQVQRLINRVSVEASFFKKLSPMENLMYGARLYGLSARETRKQVVEILLRLGLKERDIYHPMEEMSRGMQQKVAIARALLSRPRLLLLDEPTTGLDPRSKREVQAVVRELREVHGTTILLTTHDMNEAETLCDRIAIMDSGRVVALDTPAGLKNRVRGSSEASPTLEEVFLELTGKQLHNPEEDEEA